VLVVAAAAGRGVAESVVEPAGVADAEVAGPDAAGLELAGERGVVPPEGATLGAEPHPAAVKATRSTRPARERELTWAAERNIGRS
jgi:hypothetical protein